MGKLLPDRLKELWGEVDRKAITDAAAWTTQQQWMEEYATIWRGALRLEPHTDFTASLLAELGRYVGCEDVAEIERRCRAASKGVEAEWNAKVDVTDRRSIEAFYNESVAEIYGLHWWHTLIDDPTPLAYVLALEFARQHGCQSYLDFGSGVGSGGVLFARYGFQVTLADVATPLLRFCQWRMDLRKLPVQCIDLKTAQLPPASFDIVTTMDVFEHLCDPVGAVEQLAAALRPGGYLFGRFAVDPHDTRAGHVVRDLGPTYRRMAELGLTQVWRDEWLWGHQAFQKRG